MILRNTKIRRNEEELHTELRTLCLRVFVFIKKNSYESDVKTAAGGCRRRECEDADTFYLLINPHIVWRNGDLFVPLQQ